MCCLAFRISSHGILKILQAKGMVIFFIAFLTISTTPIPMKTRNMAFAKTVRVMGGVGKGKTSGEGSNSRPIL